MIKRYEMVDSGRGPEICINMEEDRNGDWVSYDDYSLLESKLDRWKQAAMADGYPCDDPKCHQDICKMAREALGDE